MFENLVKLFKRTDKREALNASSKDAAKERLHLVLMQDRANVSADFLDLMRQEIIEVIKKYIDIDETSMDVRLTNQANDDGTQGAPALYANIPILNIKEAARVIKKEDIEKNKKENEDDSKEIIEEKDSDNKAVDDKIVEKKIEEAKKIEKIEEKKDIKKDENQEPQDTEKQSEDKNIEKKESKDEQ